MMDRLPHDNVGVNHDPGGTAPSSSTASQTHPIVQDSGTSTVNNTNTNILATTESYSEQHQEPLVQLEDHAQSAEILDDSDESRRRIRSQSPSPPPSRVMEQGHDVKTVAPSNQAEEPPESPTLRRRKARPRPIIGDTDPNLLRADHLQTANTPTTTTGIASLSLNGSPHELPQALTEEMNGLPKNLSQMMRAYLQSQVATTPPTSSTGEQSTNLPEVPAEEVGHQENDKDIQMVHSASTNTPTNVATEVEESDRPSKRVKATPGQEQNVLSVSQAQPTQLAQLAQPVQPTQLIRHELEDGTPRHPRDPRIPISLGFPATSLNQEVNPKKRTFSETYTPFKDVSYKRTNNPNFNVFAHGILRSPDLLFHFVTNLPVKDFISLYAISKVFHKAVNHRFTTLILSTAYKKAPESARSFPFRAFRHLSVPDPRHKQDPKSRIPHPDPRKAANNEIRRVPGFKWLQMVLFREKVVQEMLAIMAEDGVPLPPRVSLSLKRLWLLMDLPDNARRIGYIHRNDLVTDLDIFFGLMFIVKLDQRFTDPVVGKYNDGLRRLCLGQRSLSFTWKVLKGLKLKTPFDVLKEWVKFKYMPSNPAHRFYPVFGIPFHQIGRGCLINWGHPIRLKNGNWTLPPATDRFVLVRPDQLLQREAIRRKLRMKRYSLRMLLWGYVDFNKIRRHQWDANDAFVHHDSEGDTLDNGNAAEIGDHLSFDPKPRNYPRRILAIDEEYSDTEELGAPEIPNSPSDRDPLLDLGLVKKKSRFVVQPDRDALDKTERQRRIQEEVFLDNFMAFSEKISKPNHKLDKLQWKLRKRYLTLGQELHGPYDEDDDFLDPERDWDGILLDDDDEDEISDEGDSDDDDDSMPGSDIFPGMTMPYPSESEDQPPQQEEYDQQTAPVDHQHSESTGEAPQVGNQQDENVEEADEADDEAESDSTLSTATISNDQPPPPIQQGPESQHNAAEDSTTYPYEDMYVA